MKAIRIFVAVITLAGMAGVTACNGNSAARERAGRASAERKAALVQEGNAKLDEINALRADLKTKYSIAIDNGLETEKSTSAEKFNWSAHKAELNEIREKIARIVKLSERVLEIDGQKVMVKNRDVIVIMRESAKKFQAALEGYAQQNG